MSEQTMWAVKRKDGAEIVGTRHIWKRGAIAAFKQTHKVYSNDWPLAMRHGYSCVRVTEVQDGP